MRGSRGGVAVRTAATLRIAGGDGSRLGVAASAVRQHLENSVLRGADLTWTAFVVLWVVWVRGESETRHVAEEAGISKGRDEKCPALLAIRAAFVPAHRPSSRTEGIGRRVTRG